MNKRIEWLDALKGIAIFLVVIRHVMQANITDCSSTLLGNLIFAVQMPLFMIVAGYFSVTNCEYYASLKNCIKYIYKRFLHYILPFFAWFLFVNVIIKGEYKRNIVKAISDLINNIDVGLWFLYVVFILSSILILAKLICNKLSDKNTTNSIFPVIVAGGFLTPFIVLAYFKGMRFLGANLLLYYYVYFVIGYLIFEYKQLICKLFLKKSFQVATFILSLAFYLGICYVHNIELAGDSVINVFLRIVVALTGSTAIAIATEKLCKKSMILKKLFAFIGKYTLEIYVVHVHYIGLLPKGIYYLHSLKGLEIFIFAFVITVMCTVGSILIIKKIPILNFALLGVRNMKK